MDKVYIGFDPGADGAMVVIKNDVVLHRFVVPKKEVLSTKPARTKDKKLKKNKNGKSVFNKIKVMDEEAYFQIVKNLKESFPGATVVLEKVKSIFGTDATANFNFGHNFGLMRGFVIACGFKEVIELTPQAWQKEVILMVDQVALGSGKNDTKATSLKAFLRLFPHTDMRATSRSTTFHEGLVDAALIAKAGMIIQSEKDYEF